MAASMSRNRIALNTSQILDLVLADSNSAPEEDSDSDFDIHAVENSESDAKGYVVRQQPQQCICGELPVSLVIYNQIRLTMNYGFHFFMKKVIVIEIDEPWVRNYFGEGHSLVDCREWEPVNFFHCCFPQLNSLTRW